MGARNDKAVGSLLKIQIVTGVLCKDMCNWQAALHTTEVEKLSIRDEVLTTGLSMGREFKRASAH